MNTAAPSGTRGTRTASQETPWGLSCTQQHKQASIQARVSSHRKTESSITHRIAIPKRSIRLHTQTQREQFRVSTQTCQLPLKSRHRSFVSQNERSPSKFQAKSLSLLKSLDEMAKPSRKPKWERGAQTSAKTRYRQSKTDIAEVESQITNSSLIKTLMRGIQKSKEAEYAKGQVVTPVKEGYNIDELMQREEMLKRDINKDNHHLYSRSRKKVLAVKFTSKQKRSLPRGQEGQLTTPKLQKFSTFYYEGYMRHYVERKNMLTKKEWIKKMVRS